MIDNPEEKDEHISVEDALSRGYLMVNLPVLFIILSELATGVLLVHLEILPSWAQWLFLISGVTCAWVYWGFAITRWRIWAFSRTDDPARLRQKAVDQGLIWPKGSFFERTEIRTAKDREVIAALELREERIQD